MTHDPAHPASVPPAPSDDAAGASRRVFLAGAGVATVAGAAAAGGLAVLQPAAAAASTHTTTTADASPATGAGGDAVVAYVRDAAGGEVRLMSGEREVVVHDRALARTLTRHFDEQEG